MTVPMIHAGALGNVPEFLANQVGWARVEQVFNAEGLALGVTRHPEMRIPWAAVMSIIEAGARCVGDEHLGLVLSRYTSFETYGTWGRYLRSAPTLREALDRIEGSIHFHSPGDRFRLSQTLDGVRVTYRYALVGGFGSDNTSYCAAGVLLSVIRYYAGDAWRPHRLNLCVPKRFRAGKIAESFECEVVTGGEVISFEVSEGLLSAPRPFTRSPLVTLADVQRARGAVLPTTLSAIVADLLRLQLLDKTPSVESVARTLRLGPRTLQRRLSEEGVTFRALERCIFIERAKELLAEPNCSVTDIAFALYFTSPAHFTRAFSSTTGMTPSQYRKSVLGSTARMIA